MVPTTTRSRLRRCLTDSPFPASKQDLLHAATHNGADDETVRALQAIPSHTYTNFAQVCASVTFIDGELAQDADKAAARPSHTKSGRAETAAADIDTESPIIDE